MDKIPRVAAILIAVILMLLLGLAAGQVGGLVLRSTTGVGPGRGVLALTQPVVPGVLVKVQWDPGTTTTRGQLVWRTAAGEVILGMVNMAEGEARIALPCDAETTGTLLLKAVDQSVVAAQQVTALPPGADCLR